MRWREELPSNRQQLNASNGLSMSQMGSSCTGSNGSTGNCISTLSCLTSQGSVSGSCGIGRSCCTCNSFDYFIQEGFLYIFSTQFWTTSAAVRSRRTTLIGSRPFSSITKTPVQRQSLWRPTNPTNFQGELPFVKFGIITPYYISPSTQY